MSGPSSPPPSPTSNSIQASHKTVPAKAEPPPALAPAARPRAPVKTESSDGEDWRDEEEEDEAVSGERPRAPSAWSCLPCQMHYTERALYLAHMAQQHSKVSALPKEPPHCTLSD